MASLQPDIPPFPETIDIAELKAWLADADLALHAAFDQGADIVRLVRTRAAVVDRILVALWEARVGPGDIALVAVGGLGRRELHPYSDVDLMVLHDHDEAEALRDPLSDYFTGLWDLGLDLGHSTRTIAECVRESTNDVSVATNLMEARFLSGSRALFERMQEALKPPGIWPGRAYFEAKLTEQVERHHRFDDTIYNLEPDLKKGLGGLRDIQTVGWVARRHYHVEFLSGLAEVGFLENDEYEALRDGLRYLWRVRWALHRLAARAEDRLLFDYQRDLARQLGYRGAEGELAVEQFMQDYFRTVMQIERLNERLLQAFEEDILGEPEERESAPELNARFRVHKGYLEAVDERVFAERPEAILELFELLQRHPEAKGIRAATARSLRRSLDVVDDAFRADPENRRRFIELLSDPGDVPALLARMHRQGFLGRYLPVFGRIEGRMQYDLFHVYTVDQHTLFVLRNLYRFAVGQDVSAFPMVGEIFRRIERPLVLYLAGLFHDIAKGRGGDHSELGEQDAEAFCRDHGVSEDDERLIRWLVRYHLLMSVTAQRQDISDPEVVNRFAHQVANRKTLDHLYLLTLADIAATSPRLWNSWRASLMSELYRQTANALERGLDNAVGRAQWVSDSRREAHGQLLDQGLSAERIEALWAALPQAYFMRVPPEQIAWQTRQMERAGEDTCVAVREETDRGSTEVFVRADNIDGTFATIVATLGNNGLNIVDARVFNTADGKVLDTFQVLDRNGQVIADEPRLLRIRAGLIDNLARRPLEPPAPPAELPRRLTHFVRAPEIEFSLSHDDPLTAMTLKCLDRPGLLARVAKTLLERQVRVHGARIATFGERVEDSFLLSDRNDDPLDEEAVAELTAALEAALSEGLPEALDAETGS